MKYFIFVVLLLCAAVNAQEYFRIGEIEVVERKVEGAVLRPIVSTNEIEIVDGIVGWDILSTTAYPFHSMAFEMSWTDTSIVVKEDSVRFGQVLGDPETLTKQVSLNEEEQKLAVLLALPMGAEPAGVGDNSVVKIFLEKQAESDTVYFRIESIFE